MTTHLTSRSRAAAQGLELTTIVDHNDMRHLPIERVTQEARFPGE